MEEKRWDRGKEVEIEERLSDDDRWNRNERVNRARSRSRSPEYHNEGGQYGRSRDHSRDRSISPDTSRRRRNSARGAPGTEIMVDNVGTDVSYGHIREIFGVYGEILNIFFDRSVRNRDVSDVSSCFITYKYPEEASMAVSHMDGGMLDRLDITVETWGHYRKPNRKNRNRRRWSDERSPPAMHNRKLRSRSRSRSRSPDDDRSHRKSLRNMDY